MSHRALIAERQRNGRFNLYHSQNGAEEVHLLTDLEDAVDARGRVDWESLTPPREQPIVRSMHQSDASGYHAPHGGRERAVDPEPVAVNVAPEDILRLDGLLMYEVLYVVDGDVSAYWLAWTYPDVIRPWDDHLGVEVYPTDNRFSDPTKVQELIDGREPRRTISTFGDGWLSDDVLRDIVRGHHREIYELQMMLLSGDEGNSTTGALPRNQVLLSPEHCLVWEPQQDDPLLPSHHPYFLPIRLDLPAAHTAATVRDSVATTRFAIGAGLHAERSSGGVIDDERIADAQAKVLREVVEKHAGSIATAFVPGSLGSLVESYQRSQEPTPQDTASD